MNDNKMSVLDLFSVLDLNASIRIYIKSSGGLYDYYIRDACHLRGSLCPSVIDYKNLFESDYIKNVEDFYVINVLSDDDGIILHIVYKYE